MVFSNFNVYLMSAFLFPMGVLPALLLISARCGFSSVSEDSIAVAEPVVAIGIANHLDRS